MTRGNRADRDERSFFAPGRVNLIGEFTDLSGGLVLPVAIDLGVRLDARRAERIGLTSESAPGALDAAPDGSDLDDVEGWGRYVAAVAAELAGLGRPPVGLAGRITSTLPIGAGLSSSAALEVAAAVALCAVADFRLEPLELALAGRRAELRAVGVPCGILDQGASVLGREGHAILLDTTTLEHRAVPLPPGVAIVVVDSGVSHRHEDSAYATRREELQQGIAALGGRNPNELTAGEAEALLAAAGVTGAPARRVRHAVSENRRVAEVVAILEEPGVPRLAELGELFRAGHESLRVDFEVTVPELDLLVDLASEAGALAARMTGGGFGGSIVILAAAERAGAIGAEVAAGYRARTGTETAPRICAAAEGAREL